MENCQQWFYVVLALIGLILFLVAMFMNYNLKLDQRTLKLEKKNGHEQHQIDDLKDRFVNLESLIIKSQKKIKNNTL